MLNTDILTFGQPRMFLAADAWKEEKKILTLYFQYFGREFAFYYVVVLSKDTISPHSIKKVRIEVYVKNALLTCFPRSH